MPGLESLRGKLLVATPGLVDPNFFRSVVLLLEHNEGGALGVDHEPRRLHDLTLELPLSPPRVTGEHAEALEERAYVVRRTREIDRPDAPEQWREAVRFVA